jgi:hypothetical protein
MRWFVRSDLDGFFGLALDNLVQLLLIDALCRYVLGLDAALVRGHILPGTAIAVLIGNVFYARQAVKLGRAEGRSDRCALPYGINTVSVFAFVFLVMLPAKLAAQAAGAAGSGARGVPRRADGVLRIGPDRARGRLRGRASPEDHAAGRPAVDAVGHRARVHLARVSCFVRSRGPSWGSRRWASCC